MLSLSYIILTIQRLKINSVDMDEVAHYEPLHQGLCYLQIQLFSSLELGDNVQCFSFLSSDTNLQIFGGETLVVEIDLL